MEGGRERELDENSHRALWTARTSIRKWDGETQRRSIFTGHNERVYALPTDDILSQSLSYSCKVNYSCASLARYSNFVDDNGGTKMLPSAVALNCRRVLLSWARGRLGYYFLALIIFKKAEDFSRAFVYKLRCFIKRFHCRCFDYIQRVDFENKYIWQFFHFIFWDFI